MNSIFLNALHCKNEERPPVWLMRQAGRHLASYRRLREKYTFLEMCHHPELIAEVTLLPIKAYGVDAAILFSDILVIPEAMNVGLHFEESLGPIIDRPLASLLDILSLPPIEEVERLKYVAEGIRCLKPQLQVPLIGFCGAPFTVASYMIEGKTSRDLKKTKQWMYRDPESFHLLLDTIADWSIAYLLMQIEAGVQAIQIFESWASVLTQEHFIEFSLRYLKKMAHVLREKNIPLILFGKGSSLFGPLMVEAQPHGIALDWNCQLSEMREKIPYPTALQGNLDPYLLYAPLERIEKETNKLLDSMEGDTGFILNLGHGVLPDVREEAVKTLVSTVQKRSSCLAKSLF